MQATEVGGFVRRRGLGSLLIFALGLFAGCVRHDGSLSGADAAQQGAIELCRTYSDSSDLSEQDLRATKIGSREDFCTKYVGQPVAVTAQNDEKATGRPSMLTRDFFSKLCQAALPEEPTSSAYCKIFADERRNEVERLSIAAVSEGRVAAMLDILAAAGFTCPPVAAAGECTGHNGAIAFRNRRLGGFGDIIWRIRWHADADGLLGRIDVAATGASL